MVDECIRLSVRPASREEKKTSHGKRTPPILLSKDRIGRYGTYLFLRNIMVSLKVDNAETGDVFTIVLGEEEFRYTRRIDTLYVLCNLFRIVFPILRMHWLTIQEFLRMTKYC